MQYWLMKSEPEMFGIDDLWQAKQQTTSWEGVRNYQARNMMRDQMRVGDLAFFYHSNCQPPGIVGVMTVSQAAHPDYSALDPNSPYYDPKATHENPRWFMVEMKFKEKFSRMITLEELERHEALFGMPLLRKGNRLSIMPVREEEWEFILAI